MHTTLTELDPFAPPSYITRNYGYLVFDTLFALDRDNRPQPQMVGSWTVSDDALTYQFWLRPGLLFHDGASVTAADVVASLRRWMPRDGLGRRLTDVTAGLEALDGSTVRLTLTRPYALVLITLAKPSGMVPFILPRRLVDIPAATRITEVVGSGPFRFVADEHREGDQVVFERFAGYVPRAEPASGLAGGKVAHVDRVEWREISDPQTAVAALLAGEVHVVENIPGDLMPLLRRTPGVALHPRRFGNTLILRFNSVQPPFNNPRVRRAVMAAVRQEDFLAAQVGDDTLYRLSGSILSSQSPWTVAVPGPGGDLDRGRALLRDSGYAGELAVILHPANLASLNAISPVAQALMRAIGMNVRMDTMDWNTVLARRQRTVPVADGGWSAAPTIFSTMDMMNPLLNLNLDASGPTSFAGGAYDPEMLRLRDAFAAETDPGRQQDIATALQRLSTEDAFSIPLGELTVVTGHRAALQGVIADQVLVFWGMTLA